MSFMKRNATYLALASLFFPQVASAASFDGSSPFICASFSEHLCSAEAECETQSRGDNDVPKFLKVSVQAKKVTGVRPSGEKIDANIENVRQSADTLFVQGAQEAFVWAMAIAKQDGDMTLTATNAGNGMVIFGACTLP
jgi:hypothetical protein